MTAELSPDQDTLTISVPLSIRSSSGRKQVVSPAGAPDWAPRQAQVNSTLVKALARAFRWRGLLEDGVFGSCAELAAAERISPSYLSRVLRLTLLAPDIVERILDGRHASDLTMAWLLKPLPVEWAAQQKATRSA
jgi:hypothetical protein